jgi:hypothetical protein
MAHHTDQEEVSPTSPRRHDFEIVIVDRPTPKLPKDIANSDTWRKRLVPLQHAGGRPITIVKPPAAVHAKLRREFKKAKRKAYRIAALQATAAATSALPDEPPAPETLDESHAQT